MDLEYGFHDLFVYSELIESQHVGDALVPLLQIAPVEGEDGQRVSKSFVRPFVFFYHCYILIVMYLVYNFVM